MVMQLCCGELRNGKITHAKFTTTGKPNGRVGPADITSIPIGSAFQTTVEFNPYHRSIDGFQLPVSFLMRPLYRSNRRWKYHNDVPVGAIFPI